MISLYWFVQISYIISVHLTYDKISVYFYPGFTFVTVLIPLVCMIIARLILAFLMMIHNNQELTKTIKKILLIFPEAILIQTVDNNSGRFVVQLVNDTAAKEIIKYNDPCGKPIDDSKLEYDFKLLNNHKNASISFEGEQQDEATLLSDLLESQIDKTQVNGTETMSSIELCTGN